MLNEESSHSPAGLDTWLNTEFKDHGQVDELLDASGIRKPRSSHKPHVDRLSILQRLSLPSQGNLHHGQKGITLTREWLCRPQRPFLWQCHHPSPIQRLLYKQVEATKVLVGSWSRSSLRKRFQIEFTVRLCRVKGVVLLKYSSPRSCFLPNNKSIYAVDRLRE